MELAVVYPVYNEVNYLENAARKTLEQLKKTEIESYQIVFVSDGSTDGTQDKADELSEELDEVTHLEFEERLGKGKAFEKAFEKTEAEKYAYCDVDLSTDLKHLEEGFNYLEDHDIAIGSRAKGLNGRSFKRKIPSMIFNNMLRLIFLSRIRDHQCGFKFFRKEVVEKLKDKIRDKHWFWDAELLIRAQNQNLDIKEFSVDWENPGDSKVDVKSDSIYFLRQIIKLRIDLWR